MTHKFTVVGIPDHEFAETDCCAAESHLDARAESESLRTLEDLQEENRRLRSQLAGRALREIVGHSPAVVELRKRIAEVDDDRPVLIAGEPGSGVETAAQAIHASGRRAHRPFVKIDCHLLTAERLEQELSPDDPPTAAQQLSLADAAPNRLQIARGGTLFIKHIDAVPFPLQKKVATLIRRLRLEVAAPGRARSIDVRVLASTHANLGQLVEQQRFRADLHGEFAVCTITTPSLRERIQDIGLLVEHFISNAAVSEGKPAKRLTIDALKLLQNHNWSANVAELRNVVERACTTNHGELLTAELVRPWIAGQFDAGAEDLCGMSLHEMERKLIETTFARCEGNRERTAKALQIGLRTLSGKLREYGYPPRGGPTSKFPVAKLRAA